MMDPSLPGEQIHVSLFVIIFTNMWFQVFIFWNVFKFVLVIFRKGEKPQGLWKWLQDIADFNLGVCDQAAGQRAYVLIRLVHTLSSFWHTERDHPLKHVCYCYFAFISGIAHSLSFLLLIQKHLSHASHIWYAILTLVCIFRAVLKGLSFGK